MTRTFIFTGTRLVLIAVIVVAIVVAVGAVIGHAMAAAQTKAAMESVSKEAGQVTASELAQWIVDKRSDYQLIDLRDPWQFDDYHIPSAINIPFDQFFASGNVAKLSRDKKVVVYGLGAGRSAQAQLLLSMKGFRAYSLNDGIIAWWDEVMTPSSIRTANPSSSGYQQARQLREYFTSGGHSSAPPVATTVPSSSAAPVVITPKPATKPDAKLQPRPATKPAAKAPEKPAVKPAENIPPTDKEKERLKLGTGCS